MNSSTPFLQSLGEWSETFRRRAMHEYMLYGKKAGLSMPQLGALIRIQHAGPCAVSDIAIHLDVTNAAASQTIDRLVQQGWLERSEDPDDRRSKKIALTNEGNKLVQESIHALHSWMAELAEHFTPEQQTEIMNSLTLLTRAAQKLEAKNSMICQNN